jgi:hypothetical protein
MKNLFAIIGLTALATLGVGSIMSSTTVQQSIITVKPATPRLTITESFSSYYNPQDEVKEFIRANVRKGYILKNITPFSAGDKSTYKVVVVMEKY